MASIGCQRSNFAQQSSLNFMNLEYISPWPPLAAASVATAVVGAVKQFRFWSSKNLTIYNIIRWFAGTNDSSTKCLMFQAVYFPMAIAYCSSSSSGSLSSSGFGALSTRCNFRVKFIYSEKAPKFCKISHNYLSYVLPVK